MGLYSCLWERQWTGVCVCPCVLVSILTGANQDLSSMPFFYLHSVSPPPPSCLPSFHLAIRGETKKSIDGIRWSRARGDRDGEEWEKGRVKGKGLPGCLVPCDDLANSLLPCLNTENGNLPPAIPKSPLTHTHTHSATNMPYVFISRWRRERSHVWQREKEK